MRRLLLILFTMLVMPVAAQAGCPAYPPETAKIEIVACRFYDAAQDAALVTKVDAYFTPGWDNAPPEKIAKHKQATFKRNTGAIITGRVAGTADTEDFFFLSQTPDICGGYAVGKLYPFSIHRTCAMVFFDAPTSRVLTVPMPEPARSASAASPSAQTLQDYNASIDKSCENDSDCTVKDVHNCCGYYPGCVNVKAKTDPARVAELCAAEGLAGVCGFEDISACHCNQGSCVSIQKIQ